MIRFFLLFLGLIWFPNLQARPVFERYFNDTYQFLETIRSTQTGLLPDSVSYLPGGSLRVIYDPTSPSNIGLDLLVQLRVVSDPDKMHLAQRNIHQILQTLSKLPYHHSGLFFNRYSTDSCLVKDSYVSSIDNLHLAFSLWAIKQSYPLLNDRTLAKRLFERMNFSFLYDVSYGLFAGGAYFKNGKWEVERWKYDYLGSEGRSLYGLGWAIGLINDKNFPQKTLRSLKFEMKEDILRLWDGGAFQLLLPRLLVQEELYSLKLRDSFLAYSHYVLEQGRKNSWPVPASHSASQSSLTTYNGKAGSPELVALTNPDIQQASLKENWDAVFTPHATFLAAPFMPADIEKAMVKAETLGSNQTLYIPGSGWLDGYYVKGPYVGKVVPVFLTLDQTMIALSLLQVLSKNKLDQENFFIGNNKTVQQRLTIFYKLVDLKLKTHCVK